MLDTSTPTMMVPVVVCPVTSLRNRVGKAVTRQWPPPDSAGRVAVWPARPAAQPGSVGMTGPGMMFELDGMTSNWGSTATTTCCTWPPAVSQSAIVLPGTGTGQGDAGGRHL